MKTKLTTEQMSELQQLGIDTSTVQNEGFTLSELIELLPKFVYVGKPAQAVLKFDKEYVMYQSIDNGRCSFGISVENAGSLIDAAYQMLCHGIKTGFIEINK